jgi:3-phosphoshikimate 1-carboxyvinyltransferase
MAPGVSKIRGPLLSDDTVSATLAAKALGAGIERGDDKVWTVKGTGGVIRRPAGLLDMGNSGTSLRIFSGLAALADFKIEFDGDESLRTRPMGSLLKALEALGAKCSSVNGKCPVSIEGPLKGGVAEIEGKSSQFVTALLFAAPLCHADTELNVFNLNEKPYVEITLDWLAKQGMKLEVSADLCHYKIKGGQSYKPFDLFIPADFSTATFPLVAAAVTGGEVEIRNLDYSDRQGDKAAFDYLERMGATVIRGENSTKVSIKGQLRGCEFDLNATPDALPAMAVAAVCAKGRSVLGNVPQARIKETDRIACMARELKKLGANVEELPDGLVIEGGAPLKGAVVDSYKDHRIAMALAIAGMTAEGATTILDAECASVTYPAFIEDFSRLGAAFKTH